MRASPAARPKLDATPLVDGLDKAITRLGELQVTASNLRRAHRQTEQLLDDIDRVSIQLRQLARGMRAQVR